MVRASMLQRGQRRPRREKPAKSMRGISRQTTTPLAGDFRAAAIGPLLLLQHPLDDLDVGDAVLSDLVDVAGHVVPEETLGKQRVATHHLA